MCLFHSCRYHFDGTSRRFFEGWYFKVSIPEANQSFAWMYTSENPGATVAEESTEGSSSAVIPGGSAQIMGANDEYLYQTGRTLDNFWAGKAITNVRRHNYRVENNLLLKKHHILPIIFLLIACSFLISSIILLSKFLCLKK